jgi:hypothetical protein
VTGAVRGCPLKVAVRLGAARGERFFDCFLGVWGSAGVVDSGAGVGVTLLSAGVTGSSLSLLSVDVVDCFALLAMTRPPADVTGGISPMEADAASSTTASAISLSAGRASAGSLISCCSSSFFDSGISISVFLMILSSIRNSIALSAPPHWKNLPILPTGLSSSAAVAMPENLSLLSC